MPPSDTAPEHAQGAAPARHLPILGMVCLCLLVVAGAVLYVRVADPFKPKVTFCAGVGLVGPPASTPEGAFSAWLSQGTGQPSESEWHRNGSTFANRTYDHGGGYGFRSVRASPGGHDWPPGSAYSSDQWSIEG